MKQQNTHNERKQHYNHNERKQKTKEPTRGKLTAKGRALTSFTYDYKEMQSKRAHTERLSR